MDVPTRGRLGLFEGDGFVFQSCLPASTMGNNDSPDHLFVRSRGTPAMENLAPGFVQACQPRTVSAEGPQIGGQAKKEMLFSVSLF